MGRGVTRKVRDPPKEGTVLTCSEFAYVILGVDVM